jgi:hypothetical protein
MLSCPRFLAHLRRSYALFPEQPATITVRRRSWLSGLITSHAWATEWADAYRSR